MNEDITVIHRLELNQLNYYSPHVTLYKIEWADSTEFTVETMQKTQRFGCMVEANKAFIKAANQGLQKLNNTAAD